MRLVLLGPPGVGKGTQGRRLAFDCGLALISTGEMLREAVSLGTPLGIEARMRIDAGLLVPDDVIIGLVRERSALPDAGEGFVLDGFPRTVPQADALDAMLHERGCKLDCAVAMTAPREEVVRRLSGRRECPVCKRAYHLVTAPPRDGVHCDDHPQAVLRQRPDDTEETVRRRLEVYQEQTAPVVDFYRTTERLCEVEGFGTMDAVYADLRRAIGCDGSGRR